MANEARVMSSLQINKYSDSTVLIDYQSRPSSFTTSVDGTKGPTPGSITVTPTGTLVDLSQLTTPALCRLMNQDLSYYVEYGLYDGATFFPIGEILPGESYIIRLSRNLSQEYLGTSTGTTGAAVNGLMLRSYNQNVNVLVEAFES